MKKLILISVICLIFIAGCTPIAPVDAHSLLGASDSELVSARGEGQISSYRMGDEEFIHQRKYDEEMFGLNAIVEYLYSDEQRVAQIVATFPEVNEDELVSAVSSNLGAEPVTLQKESDEYDFLARWEKDGVVWISRRIPNSALYVLIEKID